MRAMVLQRFVSLLKNNVLLELMELPVPQQLPGAVRVYIAACGVCHTLLSASLMVGKVRRIGLR